MDKPTYASAGVDVSRAEMFVERLKGASSRHGHAALWPAAGGYAAVYPVSDHKAIAVTTDGVGTKLLVAEHLGKHDTIGIDLVAMCANDLICVGAVPTIFLDYYAVGKLDDKIADSVIKGIVAGCDQAEMLLVGGETAEMPGVYQGSSYDLAGFAVGDVYKERLLTGKDIAPGQTLIGIASSGIHSNGLSLARTLVAKDDNHSWEELLTPTLIYVKPVKSLLEQYAQSVKGIAHITGGGWRNLFRLNDQVGFHITAPLPVPGIMQKFACLVPEKEMYGTFNMGMGLCIITDGDPQPLLDTFNSAGYKAQVVGSVTDQIRTLSIDGSTVVLKG